MESAHKTCTHCHIEKPVEAFRARQSWCKECCGDQLKQRYANDPAYRKAKLKRDNASRRRRIANPAYRKKVNTKRRQRYARPGVAERLNMARRQTYATDPVYRQSKLESHQAWLERLRETDPVAYQAMLERKNAAERQKYATDQDHRSAVIERTTAMLRKKRADPVYRLAESMRALASYHAQTPEEKRAQNDRHHQQRRAAQAQVPWVEYVDLDILYARDKGICQICHKPCKRSEASRDHVIPITEGGEHSYRNCVLAHTRCNARKGNRHTIPQQQRLFG